VDEPSANNVVRYVRHGDQRVLRLLRKNGGTKALGIYLGPFELHCRTTSGTVTYTKASLQVPAPDARAQLEVVLDGADATSVEVVFTHADHLGSGHILTDGAGALLSQEEYFPYGRSSDRRDERNRSRYIGVETDEDTGLLMTGPRTYDPVTGRFLSGDPIASEPTNARLSAYRFGPGNPIGYVDWNGYQDVPVSAYEPRVLVQGSVDQEMGPYLGPGREYSKGDKVAIDPAIVQSARELLNQADWNSEGFILQQIGTSDFENLGEPFVQPGTRHSAEDLLNRAIGGPLGAELPEAGEKPGVAREFEEARTQAEADYVGGWHTHPPDASVWGLSEEDKASPLRMVAEGGRDVAFNGVMYRKPWGRIGVEARLVERINDSTVRITEFKGTVKPGGRNTVRVTGVSVMGSP